MMSSLVPSRRAGLRLLAAAAVVATLAPPPAAAQGARRVRTLTIGGYTTPREVLAQAILPAFARRWRSTTGDSLRFEQSYLGSGAQARAIVSGFEADVAVLSLEADLDAISRARLITRDWKKAPNGGIVSRSLVVIAVRPGNPRRIKGWDDLRRPGLKVLTPNPATSGGAMWNISAIVGAAMRGATAAKPGDSAAAQRYLAEVLKNVTVMDKGARESMLTFEQGVGDAAITYENEVIAARRTGQKVEYVIPSSTIWIENPAAVVDDYAAEHRSLDVAEAFVRFLSAPESQQAFADYGFRPLEGTKLAGKAPALPAAGAPFTIRDMGGWPSVTRALFARGGMFERAQAAALGRR